MNYNQQNTQSIKYLFNKVATNYDKVNQFMSFGLQDLIKKRAVINTLLRLKKNNKIKILDLCTGTGDIAVLFQKYCKNTEITGIDFSKNMLKIAKQRTKNIQFIEYDLSDLKTIPIEKEYFDICFIGFGLRNLPDIDKFLNEVKFYIKPNGILSILDLGQPKWYMRPYFLFHYEILIPLFAACLNKDIKPYRYFIQSSKTYPSPKEIMNKLKKHGYKNIENKNFSFGVISQQLSEKV